MKLKRSIYLLIEYILVKIVSLISIKRSEVALIRLDVIGDYILFRNFLYDFRKSSQFSNKSITLIGNLDWKEVAQTYEFEIIDKFIWIDPEF